MRKITTFINRNKFFSLIFLSYLALLVVSPKKAMTAFKISLVTLSGVILIIFSVFIFIGLFQVWIKEEAIVKHLGRESGFKGLVLGALVGTALNGPLFSIFPLMKSLLKKGAKLGIVVVIFSTYSIKLPMLPLEIGLLGVKFALIRNLLMLASAFIMAPLMEWMVGGSIIEDIEEPETY